MASDEEDKVCEEVLRPGDVKALYFKTISWRQEDGICTSNLRIEDYSKML